MFSEMSGCPQRWHGSEVLTSQGFLREVLLSVSRAHAELRLESLHLEDIVSIWTCLWHQASVVVRTGKVSLHSGQATCCRLSAVNASDQAFRLSQGVLLPWLIGNSWTYDYLQPVVLTYGNVPGK